MSTGRIPAFPAGSPGVTDQEALLRDQLIDIHQNLARFIARTSRHLRGTLTDALDDDEGPNPRQIAYRSWGSGVALGLLGPIHAEVSLHPQSWLWYRLTSGQPGHSTAPAIIRGRRLEAEERLENALLMIPVAASVAGSSTDMCMALIWRSIKVVTGIVESAIVVGERLGADHGLLVTAADEPALIRVAERVQNRFLTPGDRDPLARSDDGWPF